MTVRVLVLRSAGVNCDFETAEAFRRAGGVPQRVHVRSLIEGRPELDAFDILALPGGFSYGDDLGAGAVLANQLGTRLREALLDFIDRGRQVIGICNGFQVLVRLGLLPWPGGERAVSLVENTSGLYEDRWVRLRVETDTSPLLRRGETFEVPVAHGEGRLVVRSAEDLDTLRARGQILLRYIAIARDDADAGAGLDPGYPANPNGSVEAIAGLQSPCGRVIGMMPHPERHLTALQHPNWTRRAACGEAACDAGRRGDGFVIFERMVAFAAQQAGAGVATSSGDRG